MQAIGDTDHEYECRQDHRDHVQFLPEENIQAHGPERRVADRDERDDDRPRPPEKYRQQDNHQAMRVYKE